MPDDPQQPAMPPWVQSGQGDRIPRMHEEQRRRWFAAANSGLIEPVPVAALAEAQPPAATAEDAYRTGQAVSIPPTLYPADPFGAVLVQNHITININSVEFRELNSKLDEIISLLRTSNEISGEAWDQLIAEIRAGRALLEAPKVDPKLIELLLKRPLTYLADKAAGALIGAAAATAIALLGRLTGLW